MLPWGDSLRSRTTPFVNWALLLVNFLVFLYELQLQSQPLSRFSQASQLDRWIFQWGAVPCAITDRCTLPVDRPLDMFGGDFLTLITSQFIHGGWMHLLGNLLFLWIFGDNIEDAMGHVRYLVFYLAGGVVAGLAQVLFDPASQVPSVGASGAIAAVLGAYLVLYPTAQVRVIIPIFIIGLPGRVPAVLMMGFWFLLQLWGAGALAETARGGEGGVAYWAHIGGFIAGVVLVWFFAGRRRSIDKERSRAYQ